MLTNTLNTNEVKDKAGSEVEFTRLSVGPRNTEFAKIAETPGLPYRLKISHLESGSGITLRRRSLVRFDKSIANAGGTIGVVSAYMVLDAPIGLMTTTDDAKNVVANLMSFCATTGAATTVLFDNTGNGADALVNGGL
jgi:hypothetical protein